MKVTKTYVNSNQIQTSLEVHFWRSILYTIKLLNSLQAFRQKNPKTIKRKNMSVRPGFVNKVNITFFCVKFFYKAWFNTPIFKSMKGEDLYYWEKNEIF